MARPQFGTASCPYDVIVMTQSAPQAQLKKEWFADTDCEDRTSPPVNYLANTFPFHYCIAWY